MELNIKTFLYIFLHLCPFILVCFFTISSIFGNDIKGIIYLVGLLLSIGLVIMSESILPNLGDSWFNDKQNAMCNLFSFGQSSLSKLSIGQIIIGFSFSYLVYTMNIVNEEPVFASNWPTIVFFSLLVISELGINTNIMTLMPIIQNYWKMIVGGLIGIVFLYFIVVAIIDGIGDYFKENAFLMTSNILIIVYLLYKFVPFKSIYESIKSTFSQSQESGQEKQQGGGGGEEYCYEWTTSILTYIIAGGLGVGWAAIISTFETPGLQYFNNGEKGGTCGKVKNDQFSCKVYKNGDPNKMAVTDDVRCPITGAHNKLLDGIDDKSGFKSGQYNGVSQTIAPVSGGTGATFNITVDEKDNVTKVEVDNHGKNYKKDDVIIISRANLGSPDKDLYIKLKTNKFLDCSEETK